MTMPHDTYEPRTVAQFRKGDHVWDETLGRWKRITSIQRYRSLSRRPMVKIVMDFSIYHRPADHTRTYMVRTGISP